MSILSRFRSMSTPPPDALPPSHAADRDSAPALAAVPRPFVLDDARRERLTSIPHHEPDSLPPLRVVQPVAYNPDPDPPLFQEVMDADRWETTDEPPLHHQLETAVMLDLVRFDMDAAEWQEIADEAAESVDFGWGRAL